MDPHRIDDNRWAKLTFALSLVSAVISLFIIIISSSANSSLGANYLKILTITFASVTICCQLLVIIARHYQRGSRKCTQAIAASGRLPRMLPWGFFLLATMWIVQFSLLTVASGKASDLNSTAGSPPSGSSWRLSAELCLTTFGIFVLVVLGGLHRVRFCQGKLASAHESDCSLNRDVEEMPTVGYIKEPPPAYHS